MSPDQQIAASVSSLFRSSRYELPLMLRIWPLVTCSSSMSIAAVNSSSPQSPEMSTPLLEHDEAHRVAHLAEHADAALELGVPEVVDRAEPARHLLLVPADAGEAALPRQGVLAARVEVGVLQVGVRFALVRDVAVVELLRVAEADPAADHPVGEADGVGADVLAERELVLDLAGGGRCGAGARGAAGGEERAEAHRARSAEHGPAAAATRPAARRGGRAAAGAGDREEERRGARRGPFGRAGHPSVPPRTPSRAEHRGSTPNPDGRCTITRRTVTQKRDHATFRLAAHSVVTETLSA